MIELTRWYLKRGTGRDVVLIVERICDRRGYRLVVADRHVAREKLPGLRALVEMIDAPAPVVRTYDPVACEP